MRTGKKKESDLGCPSGVRVSQCCGASWVSASSSQSCLSDSGSRRDCKNDDLQEVMRVKLSNEEKSVSLFDKNMKWKTYLSSSVSEWTKLSRYARKWLF